MCAPVNGKLVVLWLNVVCSQLVELWHNLQSVGNLEATCPLALLYWTWWQETHSELAVVVFPRWQSEHCTMAACPPVNSNPVVACLNDEGCQAVEVWQILQSTGMPAFVWFGICASVKFFWWQLLHSAEVFENPLVWHRRHFVFVWAPINGKLVVLWLNAPSLSPCGWQE